MPSNIFSMALNSLVQKSFILYIEEFYVWYSVTKTTTAKTTSSATAATSNTTTAIIYFYFYFHKEQW